jgi:uncharacterized protein with HEPN domain
VTEPRAGDDPATAPPPFRARREPLAQRLSDEERTADLLTDMAALFDSAARIATRGRVAFDDPVDDTARLAVEAILIRLAEMSTRLPEAFRSEHPEAPWDALRAVRNRVSYDYRSVDGAIIWEVLAKGLPDFRGTIGI